MAALLSSCVSFFPLVAVIVSVKQLRNVHQTHSECDSIVLILSCLSLLFRDSGKPGRLQLFYKQEAGEMEEPAGFCSVPSSLISRTG